MVYDWRNEILYVFRYLSFTGFLSSGFLVSLFTNSPYLCFVGSLQKCMMDVIDWCLLLGIREYSILMFSFGNYYRPPEETQHWIDVLKFWLLKCIKNWFVHLLSEYQLLLNENNFEKFQFFFHIKIQACIEEQRYSVQFLW